LKADGTRKSEPYILRQEVFTGEQYKTIFLSTAMATLMSSYYYLEAVLNGQLQEQKPRPFLEII